MLRVGGELTGMRIKAAEKNPIERFGIDTLLNKKYQGQQWAAHPPSR
jgi:hypothetical protein